MLRKSLGVCATVLALLVVTTSAASWAAVSPGTTERVSVDSSGNEGNGSSEVSAMSDDGRFVAFVSGSTNLVPGGSSFQNVFVHDRQTGATQLVGVDSSENEANNHVPAFARPSVSQDGRYIAFSSPASNLVAGDTNGGSDVFVRDLQLGTTERVSIDSSGNQLTSDNEEPSINDDGRFIAFSDSFSIFLRDRQAGTTTRMSVDNLGNPGNGRSFEPTISGDGRFVAFWSDASNLVPGDTNGTADVFVRDRQTSTTERVSVDSLGNQANGFSFFSDISDNGRFVSFSSGAPNLVPGDTNGRNDVFLRDRLIGTTERVSLDELGNQAPVASVRSAVSGDGRFVAFESFAPLTSEDSGTSGEDIYLRDRQAATTQLVSVSLNGFASNNENRFPDITEDGGLVAWAGNSSNLVANDTNGRTDIFVRGSSAEPTPAFLALSPVAATNPVGTSHAVTATVTDSTAEPVPGVVVQFTVQGSVSASGSCTTDANGQCSFTYQGPPFPGADTITAFADTNEDGDQDPGEPSGAATKTWVLPVSTPGCEVTISNGGQITANNGDKATFGGHALVSSSGEEVSGQQEYQDHGPVQPMNVHSINVLATACSVDRTEATIFGEATIDGSGSFDYRIRVKDAGEPGTNDQYGILLSNGYFSGDQTLEGGNVQITVHEE